MTTTTKCTTTVGVFTTLASAQQAISALKAAGYRNDQIGLIGKDADGKIVKKGRTGDHAEEGAAIGVAAGAVGGAVIGAGILAGVIPVIGPVLAIGTLGTILLNAAGGAAIAGIAGALIGWGIPEEDAKYYENQVHAGRYLVTVDCGTGDDARDVIAREGGFDRTGAPW